MSGERDGGMEGWRGGGGGVEGEEDTIVFCANRMLHKALVHVV